MVHHIKTES